MMSPIGLYLAEFAPPTALHPSRCASLADAGTIEDDAHQPQDAEPSPLQLARREGEAEGRMAAETEFAGKISELESRHAEHLEAERRRWADQEGTVLAGRLESGLAELEGRLAEAIVEILTPFLDRAVRVKLGDELKQAIDSLLDNGTSPAVQVLGPADLVEPLRVALEGRAGVSVLTAERPDVVVLAGDTKMRSQLETWASRLDLAAAREG